MMRSWGPVGRVSSRTVRVMVASGRSRMSSQPRERLVRVEVGVLEGVGGVLGVGPAGEANAGEALGRG